MLTSLASLPGRIIEVYNWVNDKVISLVLMYILSSVFLDCFTPGDSIVEVLVPRRTRNRANPYSPLGIPVFNAKNIIKKKSK